MSGRELTAQQASRAGRKSATLGFPTSVLTPMPTSTSAYLYRWATVLFVTAAVGLAMSPAAGAIGDARSGEQWAIADSVLGLPAAWKLSRGAGVVVAVVDSGAKLDHPDLAPNIWTNFDEVPGNRVDDDRNGYVDDVHGVDFSTASSGNDLSDGWGHGTHVAGIIAAAQNGRGVVGVAPRARLMILKVLDAKGAGTTNGVAEAIRYAAANGARVVNLSLSGPKDDPGLRSAVAAAAAANVLIVTSAGNDGRDVDRSPNYPASIAAPNLVAVAGTQPQMGRELGDYSNFGRRTIHLAAPGGEILSSTADGGWGVKTGTSMAAPQVSGVAALMAAVRGDLSAADLRAQLIQNASRASLPVSSGYLDALGAVSAVSGASSYDVGQRPVLRVLRATASKRGRKVSYSIQTAVTGAAEAVTRYRFMAGSKRLAVVRKRGTPFTLNARGKGKPARRVTVIALNRAGKRLATTSARVRAVAKGKRRVRGGKGCGRRRSRRRRPRAAGQRRHGGGSPPLPERVQRRPAPGRGPRLLLPPQRPPAAALHDHRGRQRRRAGRRGARHRRHRPHHPAGVGRRPHRPRAAPPRGQRRVPGHQPRQPAAGARPRRIQALVAGRATTWAQVPGARLAGPLAPAALAPSTGQHAVFASTFVDLATPVLYRPRTFATPQQVRVYVLATPSAWGYVDFAFTKGLHVVPYEGVPCSRATIASGAYPARSEIAFVTRGAPRGAAARFIRWTRTSALARRIIRLRYVPDAEVSAAAGQGLEPR